MLTRFGLFAALGCVATTEAVSLAAFGAEALREFACESAQEVLSSENGSLAKKAQCFELRVPMNHNDTAKEITLKFARFQVDRDHPQPVALVAIPGGPGSYFDYADFKDLKHEFDRQIDAVESGLDLILYTPRGTGHSTSLTCPEIYADAAERFWQAKTFAEMDLIDWSANLACAERMRAEGLDLARFGAIDTAQDLESMRVALGYERLVIYGVSYGSAYASEYARAYPGTTQALILDGVFDLRVRNSFIDQQSSDIAAYERLFEYCNADPDCFFEENEFREAMNEAAGRLAKRPISLPVTHPRSPKEVTRATFGPHQFAYVVYNNMYLANEFEAQDDLILSIRNGAVDKAISEWMYWAKTDDWYDPLHGSLLSRVAQCTDEDWRRGYQYEDLPTASYPVSTLEVEYEERSRTAAEECHALGIQQPTLPFYESNSIDAPTVFLHGAWDPVTGTEHLLPTKALYSNSRAFVFEDESHGVLTATKYCAGSVVMYALDSISEYEYSGWQGGVLNNCDQGDITELK